MSMLTEAISGRTWTKDVRKRPLMTMSYILFLISPGQSRRFEDRGLGASSDLGFGGRIGRIVDVLCAHLSTLKYTVIVMVYQLQCGIGGTEEKWGNHYILSVTRQDINFTAYSHATLSLLRRSVVFRCKIVVKGNNAIIDFPADSTTASYLSL
jgi:hypothetical protein